MLGSQQEFEESKIQMTISWLYMCLAIILELAATTCIKLSRGLTELLPSILIFVFYAACFSFFALAVKKLNLGLTYAIWSGVGTLGVTLIGILWLHEQLSWGKALGIALILIGLVTLNSTDINEEELAEESLESEKDVGV